MNPAHMLVAALMLASGVATARTAHPDFSGSWERYPPMGEKADPRFAPTPVPDPPLKEPWLSEWKKHQVTLQARMKEGQPPGDDYVRCLPDGMPAMMQGMFPMEVMQRGSQVNITQEAFNQTRRIYLDEKLPAADEVDPTFFGASVGRWDGDTLVVETIGINERVRFRWTPHSEGMKITERIRLLAPDMLEDKVSVEDAYFTKPWTYSHVFRRMPGYKLQEYVCEDNREYVDEAGRHRLRIDGEAPR
jgi:hypothetical protein